MAGRGDQYIEHGGYTWRTLDGADPQGGRNGAPNGGCQRICTGGAVSTPGTSTVAAGDPMTWNYDRESRSQCSVCLLF